MAEVEAGLHARINADRKRAFPNASDIKKFRRYAKGDQRSTLTAEQYTFIYSVLGNPFADNVCRKILTEAANRLELIRFDVADDGVTAFLDELFIKNQLADLSGDCHYSTLRDGNHAIALRWDNEKQRVTLHRERWWDGKEGIYLHYNDAGQPEYAVKDWITDDKKRRRVVWWPDRIERYILEGAGYQPFQLPGDSAWPLPWLDEKGEPLGIPLVHFANGSDDDRFYGTSDLDGGVLGLQDEINDIQRDITTASRMTAYQMVYATGVTLAKDASGQEIPLRLGPGMVFNSENKDAKFGTLAAGDLSQLEKAYTLKLQAISRMTDTPVHFITGGSWPSGEALIRAEQPLVNKVQKLAKTVGPAWSTTAHLATKIANAFGRAGLDTESLITAIFAPPEKRDPLTQADIATKRAAFVSRQETLRILGYSPDAITRILEEIKEEGAGATTPATTSADQGQDQAAPAADQQTNTPAQPQPAPVERGTNQNG